MQGVALLLRLASSGTGSGPAGSEGSAEERHATRHRPSRAPRTLLTACTLFAMVVLATATGAAGQGDGLSVLVFHDGGRTSGVTAIQDLGTGNGFAVDATQDPADFTAENLEQYRAVIFLDNAGNQLDAAQESALQEYVNDGGGFVGIGAAAEAEPDSNFFDGLIGARPDAASSGDTTEQVVAVGDRVHPATRDLPLEWTRSDVWYQWEARPTGQVHTVARYHAPGAPAGDGTSTGGTDHPISWCRDFQGGRSFYTGMGRTDGAYGEADFQTHLLGAIQWASGMLRAGCKATINSNYESTRLSNGASGDLQHNGESHGLSIAPNGWIVYIGRGDCRTAAQRGEIAGLPGPTGRILDFADPNVGVGCGNVHIFDPAEYDGTMNSGSTLAGIVPVYGDRGSGGGIKGQIEGGGGGGGGA